MEKNGNTKEDAFQKTANRVSAVTILGNTVLSVLKFLAGIMAHSNAMVSDAVHSASDVFSTIVVIIGIRLSAKESDKEHPYGHERLECVASIVLAVILCITGCGIGYKGIRTILDGHYEELAIPGILALAAAVLSIIVKEWMFWYTRAAAKKINSGALMADAWHHRSDSLSSIGALIGIGGAIIGYPVMEPIASIVICVFIEKAAFDIFKDAIDKMVDKSCDEQMETELRECAMGILGVLQVDLLRTRMFGNKIYVEMEIGADKNLSLGESHAIAEQVHDAIEAGWPKIKHILIHVNPV